MGCGGSLCSPYTKDEIDAEIDSMVLSLPVAELVNADTIKLEGRDGFFNPNSLMDPSWLKGRLSAEEYHQAIDCINRTAGYSLVGLSKVCSTSERVSRRNLRIHAGRAVVQNLNEQYSSVRFIYAKDNEIIQNYEGSSKDNFGRHFHHQKGIITPALVTTLFITFS